MNTQSIEPLVKSVLVSRSPEDAFRLFTQKMSSWWPTDSTHSVGGQKVAEVVFETKLGGRVFERWGTGETHDWAEVTAWEPPHRLVLNWHPGPDAPASTEVEVRFGAEGEKTRVELLHRGWERLGEESLAARRSYDTGWDSVLGDFEGAANS